MGGKICFTSFPSSNKLSGRLKGWFAGVDDDEASLFASSDTSTLVGHDQVHSRDLINHLSDGLLLQIFLFTESRRNGKAAEVILSHVNRRWRMVALACPGLWTRIRTRTSTLRQEEMIDCYLNRSGNLPLDIILHISSDQPDQLSAGLTLLHLLGSDVDRWAQLSVHVDTSRGFELIRRHLSKQVHTLLLTHLSVICLEVPEPWELESGSDSTPRHCFITVLPKLKSLRAQPFRMSFLPSSLDGLVTLHLEDDTSGSMTAGRFTDMLNGLPSLLNLSLYGTFVSEWPCYTCILLPNLLSLRCGSNDLLSDLLSSISAPQLESLVLKDVSDHQIRGHFTRRRVSELFGNIRNLTLNSARLSTASLANFVRDCPSITHLSLLNADADSLIQMLGDTERFAHIPSLYLQSVTIHRLSYDCEPAALLTSMVSARVLAGQPLATLRVHRSLYPRMPRLGVDGVDVHIWDHLQPWPEDQSIDDEDDIFLRLSESPSDLTESAVATLALHGSLRKWWKSKSWLKLA